MDTPLTATRFIAHALRVLGWVAVPALIGAERSDEVKPYVFIIMTLSAAANHVVWSCALALLDIRDHLVGATDNIFGPEQSSAVQPPKTIAWTEPAAGDLTPAMLFGMLDEAWQRLKDEAVDAAAYDRRRGAIVAMIRERKASGTTGDYRAWLDPLVGAGALSVDQLNKLVALIEKRRSA